MNNLPPEYRNDISIDSKISSITGFTEKKARNCIDIPEEIQTIKDLFIKRYQLPRWMNYDSKYNVIADIMRSDISMEDIQDENIHTIEDFRMCLFALICDCTVLCENGEEHPIKELWGSEIVNIDINNNILINKKSHFGVKHNIPKPNIDVKNIILIEYGKSNYNSMYALTTADEKTINNASMNGISKNEYITTIINSKYINMCCALLGIDSPEDNIDLFNVTKNGLVSIDSHKLDLKTVIAPRKFPYIDEPWNDYDSLKNYELLTDN